MSWEVGIWNEGIGGGGNDGVWMRADVKIGFSTDWLRNTEEQFKEVLKCWGMVLGINLVVGALVWFDENASHHMEIISSVEDTAVLKVWLELILTAVLVL